jgi:hypothetical protein
VMTETEIRAAAEVHGLTVEKRITTGTTTSGFATFELAGDPEAVRQCWAAVRPEFDGDAIRGGFAYMRISDADGRPYIGLESVYFG